jgi:hypothetical protein
LPLAFAPAAHAFQRIIEAGRVGESGGRHPAFVAGISLVQIALGIPFDSNDFVVFDTDQEGATPMIHASAVGFFPV